MWELAQLVRNDVPKTPLYFNGIGSQDLLNASFIMSKTSHDWYRPNNATLVIAGDFD